MNAAARVGRFHVITDETVQARFRHEQLAVAAAAGGAQIVQYREKRRRPDADRLKTARAIVDALSRTGARCIVNDDAGIALRSGASGVHLGPADADPADVRAHWPGALIGATANDLERASICNTMPVDYIGVGPVFGTRSKQRPAPVLGLDGLARICAAVDKPVIAIGGIDASNVTAVLRAGAWGFAVLGAVVAQPDPRAAAASLRERLDAWMAREVPA